jgi:hypothetical protein
MFYTIYKITNNVSGKTYVGKHQTLNLDDDYFGSGKLLKLAIKKHGRENFTKEILHVFDTEDEMNEAEKLLVKTDSSTYNMCPGGKGGWGYVNELEETREARIRGGYRAIELGKCFHCPETKSKCKAYWQTHGHRPESIEKNRMSHLGKTMPVGHQSGARNSQTGSFWITNGVDNKKTRGYIPEGYSRGRSLSGKTHPSHG